MSRVPVPVRLRLKSLALLLGAMLCWLLQYGSVQHTAGQVAPLFQAAISAAWAMLLLWLWTRWRGTALFAQGASLLSALWGGALFTLQWACLYLAVDRQALGLVAINFLLVATLVLAARPADGPLPALARTVLVPLRLLGLIGVLLLGVWSWQHTQGAAWLLTVVAASSFATGFRQTRCARMASQELMRWRFYQLCVAALLLPLMAVAFSPSWSFMPGGGALGAMLLQTVCGGLAFPFLLARVSPQAGNEAAGHAHIADVVRPDAT